MHPHRSSSIEGCWRFLGPVGRRRRTLHASSCRSTENRSRPDRISRKWKATYTYLCPDQLAVSHRSVENCSCPMSKKCKMTQTYLGSCQLALHRSGKILQLPHVQEMQNDARRRRLERRGMARDANDATRARESDHGPFYIMTSSRRSKCPPKILQEWTETKYVGAHVSTE